MVFFSDIKVSRGAQAKKRAIAHGRAIESQLNLG